jgi:lysophospholipase L1-like esterase
MKIVWLGASTTLGTGYGGVTSTQTFAYLTSSFWGYAPSDYINSGVGSSDTANMISRLSSDVLAHSPTVCAVNAGGIADMANSVSIGTYKSNLNTLFSTLLGNFIKVVAVNDVMKRYANLGLFSQFRAYNEAYEEVAASLNIPVADIYRESFQSYIIDGYSAWNARYVDDVHQTVTGNAWIASILSRPKYSGVFT